MAYFSELKRFLVQEEQSGFKIYPPVDDVFNAFKLCKYEDVKVVLIGQDPYVLEGQAHGLCFSVRSTSQPVPPSLRNIYKELEADIPEFRAPRHSNLSKWAEQGVLMLNTILTVRAGKPLSHAGRGWETFTDAVLHHLHEHKTGLVFMLWGKHAQNTGRFIDTKLHHVLQAAHPSPLSAAKGFFGCRHFSACNAILQAEEGGTPIDWKRICSKE